LNSHSPFDRDDQGRTWRCAMTPLLTAAIFCLFTAAQATAQEAKKADEPADAEDKLPVSAPSKVGNIPIWQLKPFDRLTLKNDEKTEIDVEPERLPKDADFSNVEEGKYCGKPGLPAPGSNFRKEIWYRFTSSSEGRKYEVIGKGIAKIELYEDIIYSALLGELAKDAAIGGNINVKFDDCLEMLRILQERQPTEPRNIFARIRYHAAEAKVAEFKQEWEKGFMALLEERKLYPLIPEKVKHPTWIRALDPIDRRIGELCDRWTGFLVNTRKFGDGRRVIARLEHVFPNHEVGRKWRKAYDERVKPLVARAEQQIANNFYIEALTTLDGAVEIQPDHPGMRATMDKVYAKHPRLRIAVGELPAYHSGPAGWSLADVRAADLLHERLMRVKSSKEGVTEFESRLVERVEVTDLNRRASVSIAGNLTWPDGKLVTPVDVQRVFADARQPSGVFYHPALEFLLTNVQSQPPNLVILEFDRPQFQAKAWLQAPFLRMGLEAGEATVGWAGMGPFVAQERRPDRILYLANPRYLEKGRPVLKQVLESKYATPEERIRAIQTAEVDMVDFVPFRNLPYVKNIPGVKVVKTSTPKVSLLQMNFDREALRSPTLRRAIVYAINREEVLKKVGAGDDKDVKLLTGPLNHGAFGYNMKTEPWAYKPFLAKTLVAAVAKELKAVPPLTLAHQGNESTRMACDEIAKQLRAAGLQITVVEVDERSPDPREADLRYQTLTVSDPIFDLVTVLTRDNPSLFANAGPRLRQYMIDLLQIPNVTVAAELLPEIHQALRDDVAIIPLWQWHETCLVSDAISGVPASLARLYENIDGWKTVPKYPPAHWETKPLAADASSVSRRDMLAVGREVHP
jgi:ABC-type transport system substrate-binding protein